MSTADRSAKWMLQSQKHLHLPNRAWNRKFYAIEFLAVGHGTISLVCAHLEIAAGEFRRKTNST